MDLHGALELLVGTALMAIPFVLGVSHLRRGLRVAVGALLVGLALTATCSRCARSLPLGAHAAYDWGFGVGLVVAGLGFAVVDGLPGCSSSSSGRCARARARRLHPLRPAAHLYSLPKIT